MANDQATLKGYLATALKDTGDITWPLAEKQSLVDWAVASLWPRYCRPLDPTATQVTIVASTYYYSLPSGVRAVSSLDLIDTAGNDYGAIHGRAWELVGDVIAGTGKLHVGPAYVGSYVGGKFSLHGYGLYDTSANYIPDLYISLVIAKARAEAYRRVGADREQFRTWLSRNQSQNVTINELLSMISEAANEVKRIESSLPRVWQKPVPGFQG